MIARSNSANTPSIWKRARPAGGGCVNRLLFEIEVPPSDVEFAKKADKILQRSAKPVYRPRGNDIDLATHDLFQSRSNSGRLSRPLAPLMPSSGNSSAMIHPCRRPIASVSA
jgi:hypothetical protein